MSESIKKIYAQILSAAKLSEAHFKELQSKRGFSEQTIRKNHFGSCGSHLLQIADNLIKDYKENDLIASGAFIYRQDGKALQMIDALTQDRILIPYINENEEVFLLRPHKLGLVNVPVSVYQSLNLKDNDGEVILTEGEFKAAAGCQLGFPTIAVPGIASFSKAHFPELMDLLNRFKVKRLTVMFDHEVKDNPDIKERYKKEAYKRYDTEFYSYFMASRISRESIETRIAELPGSWMVDGKIDIDGALAQGKTTQDFRKLIESAKTHSDYLKSIKPEAKQIILRKLAKQRHKSHIQKEFGHYVATRRSGKNTWDEVISNFIIKIEATHKTPEGIIRDISFLNEFGEKSRPVSISSSEMPRSDSFAAFCLSQGNYVWRGNKDDLSTIWEAEFLENDGRFIYEPDHIGYVASEKIWLFGNVAVRDDGKVLRPDNSHVFWLEKRGLKPVSLGVTSGRSTISEGIPYLSLTDNIVNEVKEKLSDTIGRDRAVICLGWVSAVPFIEDIFKAYGCFPFLFLSGKRGSGKSTVAEWLMNFFGLENAGKMISETTQVAIQRYLSYYSCLPVFLDEYRNTKQIASKDGFLRNSYNRQTAGKGIKAGFGLREAKIRGSLVIAGEDIPKDSALKSRCIEVYCDQKRKKANHFNWFTANKGRFSSHFYEVIRRKKELKDQFMTRLEENRKYLDTGNIDPRYAINYAIVATACSEILGEVDQEFAKYIVAEASTAELESEKTHALSEFLEGLLYMKNVGVIDGRFFDYDAQADQLYLWFEGTYNKYCETFSKINQDASFSRDAIKKYIQNEEYFVRGGARRRLGAEPGQKRCLVLDVSKAPEPVSDLCDSTGVTSDSL